MAIKERLEQGVSNVASIVTGQPGLKLWRPPRRNHSLRVTVVRQLGGIGDFLMLSPVFRGLKEKYPGCHITFATDKFYGGGALPLLARGNPYIDQIVLVDPHEFVCSPTRHVRQEYRNTPNHHVPHCVIETDLVMDLNVCCAITETAQQPAVAEHRTDIWCRTAQVFPSSKRPILVLTEEELAEGARWCQQHLGDGVRVGVVLSAADPARDWPHAAHFAVDLKEAGYRVCSIDLHKRAHPKIPAMLGMHIRKTAAAVAHLDAVVSPDTGILHVAGTLGVPTLGLFGPTPGALRMREYPGSYSNPGALVPCSPCWYLHSCRRENPKDPERWYACMRRISRDYALHELEAMLRRFGKEPPRPA